MRRKSDLRFYSKFQFHKIEQSTYVCILHDKKAW